MILLLLLVASCVEAQVPEEEEEALRIDIELDGRAIPVTFARGADLEAVAAAWAAAHPEATGAGCDNQEACVVKNILEAMRREVLDSSSVGDLRLAAEECGEEAAAAAMLLNESDPVVVAYGLEQLAGLCLAGSLELALRAGKLAVEVEAGRADAAGFCIQAAAALGRPGEAARCGLYLARAKRPPSRRSETRHFEDLLPRRASTRAALLAQPLDETVAFGALHSSGLTHAAAQFLWLTEERPDIALRACSVSMESLQKAARGFAALADANDAMRREQIGTTIAVDDAAVEALLAALPTVHRSLEDLVSRINGSTDVEMARSLFGRAVCVVSAGDMSSSVVSLGDEAARVAEASFAKTGVAIVDDVLTEATLVSLREFLRGSTIFTRTYVQGYLGAFLADGFGGSPLIWRLAADVKARFPTVLGDAALVQAWAYVYARSEGGESHPRGIDAHSDDADVSVNVWITADASNLARSGRLGGLLLYDKLPPTDWNFERANAQTAAILDYLGEEQYAHQIPHRCNRAVLLNGHKFHQTDSLDFKTGFKHHRINLTFLFRKQQPTSTS